MHNALYTTIYFPKVDQCLQLTLEIYASSVQLIFEYFVCVDYHEMRRWPKVVIKLVWHVNLATNKSMLRRCRDSAILSPFGPPSLRSHEGLLWVTGWEAEGYSPTFLGEQHCRLLANKARNPYHSRETKQLPPHAKIRVVALNV